VNKVSIYRSKRIRCPPLLPQDQIICSLHQFVESSPAEIKSGWKPLFGALRHKKLPYQYFQYFPESIVLKKNLLSGDVRTPCGQEQIFNGKESYSLMFFHFVAQ
jgi:hypothetical protein